MAADTKVIRDVKWIIKCESGSSRFQPWEGPSRGGLLRDYTTLNLAVLVQVTRRGGGVSSVQVFRRCRGHAGELLGNMRPFVTMDTPL